MIDIRLSSGPQLTAQQTKIVLYACLWNLLDGELVRDGKVWRDSPSVSALYSPTYEPLRDATELDSAVWTLLQHLNSTHQNLRPAAVTPASQAVNSRQAL